MAVTEPDPAGPGDGPATYVATHRPTYLVDKSALARAHHPDVRNVLQPLATRSQLATCAVIDLELLYSARSPGEYRSVLRMRRSNYRTMPITQQICDRAIEVQATMAERSQHRGASIPDLMIAACAEHHQVTLLHYDADFDLIASVTGQAVQWVAPRGSLS